MIAVTRPAEALPVWVSPSTGPRTSLSVHRWFALAQLDALPGGSSLLLLQPLEGRQCGGYYVPLIMPMEARRRGDTVVGRRQRPDRKQRSPASLSPRWTRGKTHLTRGLGRAARA